MKRTFGIVQHGDGKFSLESPSYVLEENEKKLASLVLYCNTESKFQDSFDKYLIKQKNVQGIVFLNAKRNLPFVIENVGTIFDLLQFEKLCVGQLAGRPVTEMSLVPIPFKEYPYNQIRTSACSARLLVAPQGLMPYSIITSACGGFFVCFACEAIKSCNWNCIL